MTSELRTRTISAVILGVVALTMTLASFWSFAVMCILGAGIVFREWRGLTRHRDPLWIVVGLLYIGTASAILIMLRYHGVTALIYLLGVIWGGDIAAYLIGKRWGKHKIAPAISPGKSWEGLISGMLAGAGISAIFMVVEGEASHSNIALFSIASMALVFVGFLGDLFESSLKRNAGVKDSGHLIPGHGGLFDRVDSLIAGAIAAPVLFIIVLLVSCTWLGGDCP